MRLRRLLRERPRDERRSRRLLSVREQPRQDPQAPRRRTRAAASFDSSVHGCADRVEPAFAVLDQVCAATAARRPGLMSSASRMTIEQLLRQLVQRRHGQPGSRPAFAAAARPARPCASANASSSFLHPLAQPLLVRRVGRRFAPATATSGTVRSLLPRRRRRGSSSRPSGSGRTCGRGSGRSETVRPCVVRVTTSIRSSMMS